MIKRFTLSAVLLLTALLSCSVAAQSNRSDGDRQRWLNEIRGYKHEFMAKELNLTRDQQNAFFPLYDEMEDEVERLNSETRDLENSVNENTDASEVEIEAASRKVFELKEAEGKIELRYYDKFKEILQPRQLLQLKNAERRFTQQLVNRHRRIRPQGNRP